MPESKFFIFGLFVICVVLLIMDTQSLKCIDDISENFNVTVRNYDGWNRDGWNHDRWDRNGWNRNRWNRDGLNYDGWNYDGWDQSRKYRGYNDFPYGYNYVDDYDRTNYTPWYSRFNPYYWLY